MNADTTLLQAEVQRLRVFVDLLLEKNSQLEAELVHLRREAPSKAALDAIDAGAAVYPPPADRTRSREMIYPTAVDIPFPPGKDILLPADVSFSNEAIYLHNVDIPFP